MGWLQVSTTSVRRPLHTSSAPRSLLLIYLSRVVSFRSCFSLKASRSLIYILCTFFLKLPKILRKGKLCCFMLYLKKPNILFLLIKGGERILEASDKIQAIANLRKKTAPSSQSKLGKQVGNGTKVAFFLVFFFLVLVFFSLYLHIDQNSFL